MALCAAFLFCLLAVAGCGNSPQLTSGEADRALTLLDSVQQYVDEGKCKRASAEAQKLSSLALAVGSSASDSFRDAFRESTDRLEELVTEQCEQADEPTGPTGATPATGSTGPTGTTGEVPPAGGGGGGEQPPAGGGGGGGGEPPPGGGTDDGGSGDPGSGGVSPQ